ncbi:hypothetical protein [Geomicrobium sp. JCM 19038]|uniref:hypothetical protein n=1 Tax=Geomicrobium sp. JCM 19038 TaxID=1460635 RepID=UPI00045F3550|nr:hypothetical protein [Geomicrobium sp. JCM 19038]GAK08084.1 hypothetical protein JCM19038_1850 [Geomicrobium sp. JCM 19038]
MKKETHSVLFLMLIAFIITYVVASASARFGIDPTTGVASLLIICTGYYLSTFVNKVFGNTVKLINDR